MPLNLLRPFFFLTFTSRPIPPHQQVRGGVSPYKRARQPPPFCLFKVTIPLTYFSISFSLFHLYITKHSSTSTGKKRCPVMLESKAISPFCPFKLTISLTYFSISFCLSHFYITKDSSTSTAKLEQVFRHVREQGSLLLLINVFHFRLCITAHSSTSTGKQEQVSRHIRGPARLIPSLQTNALAHLSRLPSVSLHLTGPLNFRGTQYPPPPPPRLS